MPTHPVAAALLPISQIHPNPDQPRKNFDPEALKDLKDSIQERGLINPISVMQRGKGDYLIMAGERRYRACCELGWKEIDARIWLASTPPEEVELLSIVENVQRNDLNVIERARGYQRLTEDPYKMDQKTIAKATGKSPAYISDALKLLNLPSKVQEKFPRGKFTQSHGEAILRLPTTKMQETMADRAESEGWSAKETEKRVNQYLAGQTKAAGEGDKPSAKPSWKSSDTPQFSVKGNRALVQASFDLSEDNRKAFLDGLLAPLTDFLSKDAEGHCFVNQWTYEESLNESPETEEPSASESNGQMTLPQTPKEAADLEELAAASPEPQSFYARIYGENSPVTASMAGMSWSDTPIPDPREFVRQFLRMYKRP